MKTIDADMVIQQIVETLAEADGPFIEDIANRVLTHKVTYRKDMAYEGGAFDQQE